MKTVTFNPETHAILRIEPTKAMLDGHFSVLDIEADDVYLYQYELATACFKAMIAAAPEYPADAGWISVDKRLPDDCKEYLCFAIDNLGYKYMKQERLKPAKTAFYVEYDGDEPAEKITHWMPLPPAPEVV